MPNIRTFLFTLAIPTLLNFLSFSVLGSTLLYPYSRLATRDLDEMTKLVKERIADSQKTSGDQLQPLKEVLQAVYTRPNPDGMIEKVIGPLKAELDGFEAWESTLRTLITEATQALKENKKLKPLAQVSYWIFLENYLNEHQPDLREKNKFVMEMYRTIRDAKIKISEAARKERKLRIMTENKSPSEIAAERLESIEKEEELKKKKEKDSKVKEVET